MSKKTLYVDIDGTLCEFIYGPIENLYKEGYFLNLKPHKKLVAKINSLIEAGYDVHILSAYLSDSPYALSEKKAWVKKYIKIKENKVIFVPCGEKKSDYIKKGECDILLDDHTPNLMAWHGVGIKFLNNINGKGGTWQGLKISEDSLDELETIIERIAA